LEVVLSSIHGHTDFAPVHHGLDVHLSKALCTPRLPVNTCARLSLSMGARPPCPLRGGRPPPPPTPPRLPGSHAVVGEV